VSGCFPREECSGTEPLADKSHFVVEKIERGKIEMIGDFTLYFVLFVAFRSVAAPPWAPHDCSSATTVANGCSSACMSRKAFIACMLNTFSHSTSCLLLFLPENSH
jgi:hypothetical protein